jgi:hypothetical protein
MPPPRRTSLTAPKRAVEALPRFPLRPPLPIDPPITSHEVRASEMRNRNGVRLPSWGIMPVSRTPHDEAPLRRREDR